MQLGIISMAIPLGPISHLQIQNLEGGAYIKKNIYHLCLVTNLLYHESFLLEAIPHSKSVGYH